jgi:hypothetical protein
VKSARYGSLLAASRNVKNAGSSRWWMAVMAWLDVMGRSEGSDAAISFDKGDALVAMALTVTGFADLPRGRWPHWRPWRQGPPDRSDRATRPRTGPPSLGGADLALDAPILRLRSG